MVGMTEPPTSPTAAATMARLHVPFLGGFVTGLVVTVPATVLALLFNLGERLFPFLVPGRVLLRGLVSFLQDWPGPVNVALAAVANGLLYGLVAAAVAALIRGLRAARG
jgi:hypothetical protein